jgi:hypothetical protein
MGESGRVPALLRWADLVVLALALPVFLVFGFPMLGYAVLAGVWLLGRGLHLAAQRHAFSALREGNRRGALGLIAAATLGRVWIVALAILLVGLADRKSGLAAALLAAALVTTQFASQALARLLYPEEEA